MQRGNGSTLPKRKSFVTYLTLRKMTKEVNLSVQMSCGGCSGAVTRILKKQEGVEGVEANLETQMVTVQCDDSVAPESLVAALSKWAESSNKTVELAV
jgi:copper chaperone